MKAPTVPPGCDPFGGSHCLTPWPNDYFRKDGHLALTASMMPRNTQGVPIEPSDYNRVDGFSPGREIVLKVPGLDTPAAFEQTGAVPITDLARTYARKPAGRDDQRAHRQAPADLGGARLERRLAREHRAADPPGEELPRGRPLHRRAAQAARRRRQAAARAARVPPLPRRIKTDSPPFELRRPPWGRIFERLSSRASARLLYMAWDFTVASERSARPDAAIRDGAFAELGDTTWAT